jgi:hypothetical protein
MFRLHVVLDQSRDWTEYVPLWVTALAALITVVVAVVIARNQGKLQQTLAEKQIEIQRMQLEQQERQLKKDLFDRRFAVFTDVQKFFDYVLQKNGDIELSGPGEYRQFRECMERAEMLFGHDVMTYLEDVDETARAFYVSAKRRGINLGDVDAINKDGTLLDRLSVVLMPQRKGLFRPYLTLWSEQ